MKNKHLTLISCAAAALIASPAMGAPHKKSGGTSASKPQRAAARTTTQLTANRGHAARQTTVMYNRNMGSRFAGTPQYTGTRQGAVTRYYGGSRYAGGRYYGNTVSYGGAPYYAGGYPYYGSSSVWPYVAASVAPYVASSLSAPRYGYYPYSYYGGYPYNYSYNGGYPYSSSYYGSGYGYGGSTVAAVQQRLGELGYYHGAIDGVIGPQTRTAIAAYESRHGLIVDGRITGPLLNRLGVG